jgi:hypothetical protein
MKIGPVGAALSHADRRTDGLTEITKLTAAFRNFANAPQKMSGHSNILGYDAVSMGKKRTAFIF